MKIIPYQDLFKDKLSVFIDTIYKEFGDRLFTEGFDSDLLDVNGVYEKEGGKFWLCIDESENICGTLAFNIKDETKKVIEMKRFYIEKNLRGTGIAENLYRKVLDWCKQNNYRTIILWSDKRFTRSHNFYLKRGYQIIEEREMNDGAMPYSEYCFKYQLILNPLITK